MDKCWRQRGNLLMMVEGRRGTMVEPRVGNGMAPGHMLSSRTRACISSSCWECWQPADLSQVPLWDWTEVEDGPYPATRPYETITAWFSQLKLELRRAVCSRAPREIPQGTFTAVSQVSFSLSPACIRHSLTGGVSRALSDKLPACVFPSQNLLLGTGTHTTDRWRLLSPIWAKPGGQGHSGVKIKNCV